MSKVIEVNVPDIGGHNDVDVIEVAVKVGDTVALEDTLITLETDKATMDVPSTVAGVITAIKVNVGSKVSEGDCIVLVEAAASAAARTQRRPAGPRTEDGGLHRGVGQGRARGGRTTLAGRCARARLQAGARTCGQPRMD